eukprot:jgi/Botrbrau1/9605/Bobra.106_2s0026.1
MSSPQGMMRWGRIKSTFFENGLVRRPYLCLCVGEGSEVWAVQEFLQTIWGEMWRNVFQWDHDCCNRPLSIRWSRCIFPTRSLFPHTCANSSARSRTRLQMRLQKLVRPEKPQTARLFAFQPARVFRSKRPGCCRRKRLCTMIRKKNMYA